MRIIPPRTARGSVAACLTLVGALFAFAACTDSTPPPPEARVVDVPSALADQPEPSLLAPRKLGPCSRGAIGPTWTRAGLLVREAPRSMSALAIVKKPGLPIYDPSTDAWYASANGSLVRLDEGGLRVVADGIQGIDVDVRADQGLAVSREPNDTIVLHRFGDNERSSAVLLRGGAFFRPRFSPNAERILVAESRAGGGHVWIVSLDGGARDLTQGSGGSWHPDGEHVVFARVRSDGHTITASELWMASMKTGEERKVGASTVPAIDPVISPDGTLVAFVDGKTRDVFVARLDNPFEAGGR